MTPDLMLWCASSLSLLWFFIHLFLGGKEVACPLRQSTELSDLVKGVAWMCWHFVSVALGLMAVFLAGAAYFDMPGLTWASLLLAVGFTLIGLFAAPFMGVPYKQMPQGFLFIPIAVLAALAL